MDKLSFAPLSVVDYGGGIIITDWFSEGDSNEEIKIAVRFLSNEIRSDAIKIIIHKKKCETFNNCKISTINGTFDLLHKGHIDALDFALSNSEKLYILVNSDRSVGLYKGPSRPIDSEQIRINKIESLIN